MNPRNLGPKIHSESGNSRKFEKSRLMMKLHTHACTAGFDHELPEWEKTQPLNKLIFQSLLARGSV